MVDCSPFFIFMHTSLPKDLHPPATTNYTTIFPIAFSHQSHNRLSDLVAEHLDHLHYLNDILLLNITDLNQVLADHLLHKLLIPLYIYSLLSLRRHSEVTMEKATMNLARVLNKPVNFGEMGGLGLAQNQDGANVKISCVVALFLLSQVSAIRFQELFKKKTLQV